MENMRKRVKIRTGKKIKDFIKYTSQPVCVSWNPYDKKLAAIHQKNITNFKQTHKCWIYCIK